MGYIVKLVGNCCLQSLPYIALWMLGRLLYLLCRKDTGLKGLQRREEKLLWLLVIYLILLIQITVFRYGLHLIPLDIPRTMNFKPLYSLHLLARWALIYNVVGNIIWFLPLGLLAPQISFKYRRWWRMLLAGFGLSLTIETLQFIFYTGISDVDDLIFNTVGTLLGWAMLLILQAGSRRLKGK